MIRLRYQTGDAWVEAVEGDLTGFLQDHAANERRVSRSALALGVQHPHRVELVDAMVEVAVEELEHFRLAYDLLRKRGATLGQDSPDLYMRTLLRRFRHSDQPTWLLHRLVLFSVVEARGFERFALLGERLSDPALREIYAELARSEARHQSLYMRLARLYFDERVDPLLETVLDAEAEVMRAQPIRATLH